MAETNRESIILTYIHLSPSAYPCMSLRSAVMCSVGFYIHVIRTRLSFELSYAALHPNQR